MAIIQSQIDPRSDQFKANAAAYERLVEELRGVLAEVREGGKAEARAKHAARGKLFVRERIERLIDLVQRRAHERNQERVGRIEQVLVEGASRTDETLFRGRTRRNTTVNFRGPAAPGELVEVRIEGATSTTLRGSALAAVAA